jgi:L-alanine-DL-glutamate epimerase-like enolase superfamily enzyme
MIQKAKSLGMKVMLGCMNESSIGTAAIAQLAPLLDYVDMDGTLLQTEKNGEGVKFEYGKIIYNDKPGLGVEVTF